MVVGDTIISEQGLVAIIGRDPRYQVCGAAHTFEEANKLVRQHRPDLLLIEPFLENRDAIRWIKDLATEFPRIRILIVSRQSELTYAGRALHAGASGYWMKNSSVEELMRAIKTVLAGEIYASQAIAFSRCENLPAAESNTASTVENGRRNFLALCERLADSISVSSGCGRRIDPSRFDRNR